MPVHPITTASANRFLAKKWDEDRHNKHVKKIKEMKPAIDNHSPIGFGNTIHDDHERRRKAISRTIKDGDRKKTIEEENKKIVAKIQAIKVKAAIDWKKKVSIVKKSPFNPFLEKRMKEQKRIEKENEKLLEKIEMVKTRCIYDRKQYLKEYEESDAIKKRISLFPPHLMKSKFNPKKKTVTDATELKMDEQTQVAVAAPAAETDSVKPDVDKKTPTSKNSPPTPNKKPASPIKHHTIAPTKNVPSGSPKKKPS